MGLSICNRMGYAGKICQETVGSFCETNPPERVFGGVRLRRGTNSARVVGLRFWKTNPISGCFSTRRCTFVGELGGVS